MPRGEKYGRRRGGKASRLADGLVIILTVAATALLLCACLARYVDPNRVWFLAFAGMAAPVIYVVNLALAFYWIIRWRWCALLPVLALVAGIGLVPLFLKPALGKHRTAERSKGAITVMSYNVAGFLSVPENGGVRRSSIDSIAALVGRTEPDILCIQEFQSVNAGQKKSIDSLLGMPREVHNYRVPNSVGGGWGMAIYSRHKILESGVVDFDGTTNSAIWADVAVGGDTLRVFNCHLQTTSIKQEDIDFIMEDEFIGDDGGRVRSIASRLRRNFRIRAGQADTLAPLIEGSPYRVIVCGDFNDTPLSYVYRRIRGRLSDTFVERGVGMPNTYRGFFNLLRIDYIFHSRALRTLSFDIPQCDFSDHKPVVAELMPR